MSKYLISVTETYRVDTEAEAAVLIDEAKKDNKYDLKKYTSQKKERKQKGDVVDEWHQVVLTKIFDDEKEPIGAATVEYKVGGIYE